MYVRNSCSNPMFYALTNRIRKSMQVSASFRLPFRLAIHLR